LNWGISRIPEKLDERNSKTSWGARGQKTDWVIKSQNKCMGMAVRNVKGLAHGMGRREKTQRRKWEYEPPEN